MRGPERLYGLLRKVGTHAIAQVGTQVLSFAAGVIVVRELSTAGYAQYAICTAVLAAMLLLSDSGISATLMAGGAALLDDRTRFTGHFKAALVSRWGFSVPIVGAGAVWTYFLLTANESDDFGAVTSVTLTLVSVFASLDVSLQQVVHRLHLQLGVLRVLAVGQAGLRLVLTAAGLLVNVHNPQYFLLVMAISSVAADVFIRFASRKYLDRDARMDRQALPKYRRSLAKTLPMVALLIAGEQVFLGLISTAGTTESLSTFTALSRFGVLFLVLNSLVSDMAAPLVARAAPDRRSILLRIGGTVAGYGALSAALIAGVWLMSGPILGLLGPRFHGLTIELTLVAVGYATYNMGYCLNYLSQARGWLAGSWSYAPLIVIWGLLTAFCFDLSDLRQVAAAFILQGVVFVITQIIRIYVGVRTIGRA